MTRNVQRSFSFASWGVPFAYLALVFWLQPAGRLGRSDVAPSLGRIAFDDYDVTAMALRGWNAASGRVAGRPDPPQPLGRAEFSERLRKDGELLPRYFLEYPHAALWLFRIPFELFESSTAPPAPLADGCHNDVVEHAPSTEGERKAWRTLRRAVRFHEALMALAVVGLFAVLKWGFEPGRGATWEPFLLFLPATLYFSIHRFDVVPALLVALSFAALGRNKYASSGVLLAFATLVKVYPILLAPLVVRFLISRIRPAAIWAAGFGVTLAGVLGATLVAEGWDATVAPYVFQLTRAAEPGWTFYGTLFPNLLSGGHPAAVAFRFGSLVLLMGFALFRAPTSLDGLYRRGIVLLALFVSLQVFYSPQWIVWFTPLILPLVIRKPPLAIRFAALDLVTFLTFPVAFDAGAQSTVRVALIALRAVVLALVVFAICREGFDAADRPEFGEASAGTPRQGA